jgi:hypothetical protein
MSEAERKIAEVVTQSRQPSQDSVEGQAGCSPSPFLEDRMRMFGSQAIHFANQLGAVLNPPRLVGLDGNARAPQIDIRMLAMSQFVLLQAVAAMNDCLLVMTTGKGVLKPAGPVSEPRND